MFNKIYNLTVNFLLSGFSNQSFISNPLFSILLKIVPKNKKKNLALKIVSLSPHYFIYKDSSKYKGLNKTEILQKEHQRNIESRKAIVENILKQHINNSMVVLDFGCGPGNIAIHAAQYVKQVIAIDISMGVIACARELNKADNITYVVNKKNGLKKISDSSIDLVYSFAVIQHLSDELFKIMAEAFFRVLRPQGKMICHFVLGNVKKDSQNFLKKRASLRYIERSKNHVLSTIQEKGFYKTEIIEISKLAKIQDDIGSQHLIIAIKPSPEI